MRVLFVDQFSEWGGAQLGLRDVMAEAQRRGWEVHFMGPQGPLLDYWVAAGIATEALRFGSYSNGKKSVWDIARFGPDMLRCALAIRRFARQRQIELVVANGPRILPAVVAAGCPLVYYAHSSPAKRYARAMAGWIARHFCSRVIAVSNFAARFVKSDKLHVVYNGVKDQGFVAREAGRATVRVGIIGRIAPEKGQLDFVRAARLLAPDHPHVRFAIIGTALYSRGRYEQAVREEARDLPVDFPGWTGQIAATLHGIDVLAVPSAAIEASTRVIMEAFSAGTPVVAYRSGGIPELIKDGETGILTASAGFDALADSIRSLLADPAMMARLSKNGRLEWERRFQLERFQTDVCDLLEQTAATAAFHQRKPLPANRERDRAW